MILDVRNIEGGGIIYRFYCPACKEAHAINQGWQWNGSKDKPTFTPSVGVNMPSNAHYIPSHAVCHSYITEGNIAFQPDSTHELAGQTVPLPEFPQRYCLG